MKMSKSLHLALRKFIPFYFYNLLFNDSIRVVRVKNEKLIYVFSCVGVHVLRYHFWITFHYSNGLVLVVLFIPVVNGKYTNYWELL